METTNTTKETTFERLSKINVNEFVEKKGNFKYLSWSYALMILKKESPTSRIKVYEDVNTQLPYFTSNAGVLVKVGVTFENEETICYLPVMDFKNNAITADKVNMMDINKTIQRCTVKAIATATGLGLYLYAGEDLPSDSEDTSTENKKAESKSGKLPFTFVATGNTYNIKDSLKEVGFKYNMDSKLWSIDCSQEDVKLLERYFEEKLFHKDYEVVTNG